MKLWKIIPLCVLVAALPVFSACGLFGQSQQDKDREYYEQQIEYYKKVQEANQKAQEEYRQKVKEGLEQYLEEYSKYQQAVQKQQIEAQGGEVQVVTGNSTPASTGNSD